MMALITSNCDGLMPWSVVQLRIVCDPKRHANCFALLTLIRRAVFATGTFVDCYQCS